MLRQLMNMTTHVFY